MQKLIRATATFFGAGYTPVAPGTAASILTFFVCWLLKDALLYGVIAVVVIIIGFVVSGRAERLFGKKDARRIEIDEVSGTFIALWGLWSIPHYAVGAFIVWRILDATKPLGIRQMER